jgi:asparagine synthase (glutamine-hydrolysing)
MCGWIVTLGWCPRQEELDLAGDTMASRGPDGSGQRLVVHGCLPAGLAHRRLAIIDPSPAGAQPMHDPQRGVTVVYNGEIYNSPELRRELQSRGLRFRSTSDTEVLLQGWAEWGDGVLDRIEGIYSFALLDEHRGRALLARDRAGVKPLYWAHAEQGVVAGSAPRALLALVPKLRADLDEVALAQYLTLLWIPHPRTPWANIHKLPPGSALSVEAGRVRQWRYWEPPDDTQEALSPARLRSTLESATTRQLLSDVEVGLLLSGGLDSSLLLAFMARFYAEGKLHAVTAGYDEASQRLEVASSDLPFARMAAATHGAVSLTEVEIGVDATADLDRLAWHFDDPVADPAAVSLWRLANASPTKVLLSGVGGEELLAGYPRHQGLGLARLAARTPGFVRQTLSRIAPTLYGGRPGALYRHRRNAQKLLRVLADDRSPHYWRMMAQATHTELRDLVGDPATSAFDELDGLCPPLAATSLADALAFDRSQFLPNLNLAYVDKAAMAASVEVRVPLLDEGTIDLVYRSDPSSLLRGSVTKAPLRTAAIGLVPGAILDRPKSGFGGPVRSWFRGASAASLRDRIDAIADAGLVNRAAARSIVDRAATGRQDASLAGWALACLEAWHAEHAQPRRAA